MTALTPHPWLVLCILLLSLYTTTSSAAPLKEYDAKVIFSFNFARYTQWPEHVFSDPETDLNFCVLAQDSLISDTFQKIAGKKIGTHRIHLSVHKRITLQLQQCHALFVEKMDRDNLPRLFSTTQGYPILMIGEMADFASTASGGMINFTQANKFEVNPNILEKAGLKLSAKVLKLKNATIIQH